MPRAKAVPTSPSKKLGELEVAFVSGTVERPVQPSGIPMAVHGDAKVFEKEVHPEERMNPEYHAAAKEKHAADKAKAAMGFGMKATIIGASPNAPGNTKFVFN